MIIISVALWPAMSHLSIKYYRSNFWKILRILMIVQQVIHVLMVVPVQIHLAHISAVAQMDIPVEIVKMIEMIAYQVCLLIAFNNF